MSIAEKLLARACLVFLYGWAVALLIAGEDS